MKAYNASVLYVLLLLLLKRVDCRSTSHRSFVSKESNKTIPEISNNITIDNDTSNFRDDMILMNFLKFLQPNKATTTQSLTDEADYFEWDGQGTTFTLDGITTHNFTTRGIQYNSSSRDYEKEYVVPYSGNQGEIVKKINIEGREQIPSLKHEETYRFTPYKTTKNSNHETTIDVPLNQNAMCYVTLEKIFLKSEELSPPRIKYEPMQLRDESGQKISLNNLSDPFRFPELRDRWWWEYDMHYMHWFFWHCEHWMTYWLVDPPVSPNLLLSDYKQEEHQDYGSYRKSLEYKLYIYCNWLLKEDKVNQTNSKDGNNLKVNDTLSRNVNGNILRGGPEVSQCYRCGFHEVEGMRTQRICHRAFTDKKYFKFQRWIKTRCHEKPEDSYYDYRYYRSWLHEDGHINAWGSWVKNMCVTYSTDIGEMYTMRDCMKALPYENQYSYVYLRPVYHALDQSLRLINEVGCVATPYSFFAPFSRSKPGLFVRSYACMCEGHFCNLSSRVQFFIGLSYTVLFYLILFVFRCFV